MVFWMTGVKAGRLKNVLADPIAGQQPDQQALLRMHAVSGLSNDVTLVAIDDFVGDLFAANSRQAMQHPRGRGCGVHQGLIQLELRERTATLGHFSLLAHACPDVGVDRIGGLHRRDRVVHGLDLCVGILRSDLGNPRGIHLISLGTGKREPHLQHRTDQCQRMGNVVAIAHENQVPSPQVAQRILDRQHISYRLAGMTQIGQSVDYGHRIEACQLLGPAVIFRDKPRRPRIGRALE